LFSYFINLISVFSYCGLVFLYSWVQHSNIFVSDPKVLKHKSIKKQAPLSENEKLNPGQPFTAPGYEL